jgi:N-acetylglutamate synthase-like GNAT family acetyltransferase
MRARNGRFAEIIWGFNRGAFTPQVHAHAGRTQGYGRRQEIAALRASISCASSQTLGIWRAYMIEIVPFSEHHLSGVVDVILPIQQSEFGIPITLESQPDLLDIPGFYQKRSGNFWAALHGKEIIGTISLLDIGNGQGALRKMFVKKQFRGSRKGVAYNLLRVLLEWCKRSNLCEIYLGTTAKFLAAHRFYEKNGFLEIQKTELPVSFPVMSVDTKFYKYLI